MQSYYYTFIGKPYANVQPFDVQVHEVHSESVFTQAIVLKSDMHPWFFTAVFYGFVCVFRCRWARESARWGPRAGRICCTTPDLWHSDTFQRRLLPQAGLHNYYCVPTTRRSMHYLRYDSFRPAPPTWLFISLCTFTIYVFLICAINGYRRVTYALMTAEREWWIWFHDDWWWWRWRIIISVEREDVARAPYASQLVELTFQPRSANPPVCDNKGECVWLMGSLCYQRAIAHTCNYVPHALYDILYYSNKLIFSIFYIFFRFVRLRTILMR